jgi:ubiquinone/menaquinone biosynthesis C-methylase UbiE
MNANDKHAQVAALFDQLADSYDQVGVDYFQPIAEGLVGRLKPQTGERVLDIGCGRGAALLRLAAATLAAEGFSSTARSGSTSQFATPSQRGNLRSLQQQ